MAPSQYHLASELVKMIRPQAVLLTSYTRTHNYSGKYKMFIILEYYSFLCQILMLAKATFVLA